MSDDKIFAAVLQLNLTIDGNPNTGSVLLVNHSLVTGSYYQHYVISFGSQMATLTSRITRTKLFLGGQSLFGEPPICDDMISCHLQQHLSPTLSLSDTLYLSTNTSWTDYGVQAVCLCSHCYLHVRKLWSQQGLIFCGIADSININLIIINKLYNYNTGLTYFGNVYSTRC